MLCIHSKHVNKCIVTCSGSIYCVALHTVYHKEVVCNMISAHHIFFIKNVQGVRFGIFDTLARDESLSIFLNAEQYSVMFFFSFFFIVDATSKTIQ